MHQTRISPYLHPPPKSLENSSQTLMAPSLTLKTGKNLQTNLFLWAPELEYRNWTTGFLWFLVWLGRRSRSLEMSSYTCSFHHVKRSLVVIAGGMTTLVLQVLGQVQFVSSHKKKTRISWYNPTTYEPTLLSMHQIPQLLLFFLKTTFLHSRSASKLKQHHRAYLKTSLTTRHAQLSQTPNSQNDILSVPLNPHTRSFFNFLVTNRAMITCLRNFCNWKIGFEVIGEDGCLILSTLYVLHMICSCHFSSPVWWRLLLEWQ